MSQSIGIVVSVVIKEPEADADQAAIAYSIRLDPPDVGVGELSFLLQMVKQAAEHALVCLAGEAKKAGPEQMEAFGLGVETAKVTRRNEKTTDPGPSFLASN